MMKDFYFEPEPLADLSSSSAVTTTPVPLFATSAASNSGLPMLLQGPKGFFILFDYGASLLAVFVNLLVLRSVIKAKIHLTGYKYFLVSLGLSDLYLCVVNISVFVTQGILQHYNDDNKCWSHISRSLQIVGFMANLLNLCGMSVDHLVGIVYPFKYNRIMSKRFLRTVIGLIWLAALLIGSADIPVTSYMYTNYTNSRLPSSSSSLAEKNFNNISSSFSNNYNAADDDNCTLSNDERNSQDSAQLYEMMASLDAEVMADVFFLSNNEGLTMTTTITTVVPKPPSTLKPVFNVKSTVATKFTIHNNKTVANNRRNNNKISHRSSSSKAVEKASGKSKQRQQLTTTTTTTPNPFSSQVMQMLTLKLGATSTVSSVNSANEQQNVPSKNYACFMKRFLNAVADFQPDEAPRSWCSFYNTNNWLEWAVMTSTVCCFILLAICYGKIFNGVFFQGGEIGPKKNARKLVMTTFLLLGAFISCWLPFMIFEISMILALQLNFAIAHTSPSFLIIHNVFNSMLLSAPLIDPIIYAARLSIVRKEIMVQISRILPNAMPCMRRKLQKSKLLITWRRQSTFSMRSYENGARFLCNSARQSTLTAPVSIAPSTNGNSEFMYSHMTLLPVSSEQSSTLLTGVYNSNIAE